MNKELEFYKPNINLDLAYLYFMKILGAAATKEIKLLKPMTKERYEKYRKLYLAHRFKKEKRLFRKSNFLPIGTIHIWQDGKQHRKTTDGWFVVPDHEVRLRLL